MEDEAFVTERCCASAGFEAVVAARRSGFTPLPVGLGGCEWGFGVLAPVGMGVEKVEGSSEVKMVAEDGEMIYLAARVERRASLKPGRLLAGRLR